jgi:hypothetical protein
LLKTCFFRQVRELKIPRKNSGSSFCGGGVFFTSGRRKLIKLMHSMPAQIDKAYGLIQPVVSGTVESIAWEKKRVGRDL